MEDRDVDKIRKLLKLAGSPAAPSGERLAALDACIRTVTALDVNWMDFCDGIDGGKAGSRYSSTGYDFYAQGPAKQNTRAEDEVESLRAWFAAMRAKAEEEFARLDKKPVDRPDWKVRDGSLGDNSPANNTPVTEEESIEQYNRRKFMEAERMQDIIDGTGMREEAEKQLAKTGRKYGNVFERGFESRRGKL